MPAGKLGRHLDAGVLGLLALGFATGVLMGAELMAHQYDSHLKDTAAQIQTCEQLSHYMNASCVCGNTAEVLPQ